MLQVATTFFGIFLFGYMPSFWIRLRGLAPIHPSQVFSIFLPQHLRSSWFMAAIEKSGADIFTHGAIVQWWTMLAIVFSDVGAYFVGKRFGRTPLIWVRSHQHLPTRIAPPDAYFVGSLCKCVLASRCDNYSPIPRPLRFLLRRRGRDCTVACAHRLA